LNCRDAGADGFEWCVNAPSVDRNGTVFANSEDGYVYAITADGALREHRPNLRAQQRADVRHRSRLTPRDCTAFLDLQSEHASDMAGR
jgi:hypothetical protein